MSDVRDKAEKLIRLSTSNHENEANMAARAACKLILDNSLSLHPTPTTQPHPSTRVIRQIVREVVRVPDGGSYDRGYRVGYREGFEAAPKLLPPVISLEVVIPEFLVKP